MFFYFIQVLFWFRLGNHSNTDSDKVAKFHHSMSFPSYWINRLCVSFLSQSNCQFRHVDIYNSDLLAVIFLNIQLKPLDFYQHAIVILLSLQKKYLPTTLSSWPSLVKRFESFSARDPTKRKRRYFVCHAFQIQTLLYQRAFRKSETVAISFQFLCRLSVFSSFERPFVSSEH